MGVQGGREDVWPDGEVAGRRERVRSGGPVAHLVTSALAETVSTVRPVEAPKRP